MLDTTIKPGSSDLQKVLDGFRLASASEREKGTYLEELTISFLRNEPRYRDLYSDVWMYSDWADLEGLDKRDTGIDLVAKTAGTSEFHAIQCKLYSSDYKLQKGDIDSFFTASGKKPFSRRIILATTNKWSEHADEALRDQQPPADKIDLQALEESLIDWSKYQPKQAPVFKEKKKLRPHQKNALTATIKGFTTADRGKLIMACGTGKTFTSLKIAEEQAGKGKRVLFLVPSLSLLSQTLTEWTQESEIPLHSFAVCSDSDVGKKRKKDEDIVQTFTHELRYPATTRPDRLAAEVLKRHDDEHMSVVFSTYHSIDVISEAQKNHGLGSFDLIVCDEAHRTTGATFEDDDESTFVKVHDASFIESAKRLYMTATPRIYADSAKATAERDSVTLCSMDDPALYGEELYVITFSEAVKRGLLVDYKVIVLSVDEVHVSRRLQTLLADDDNQLRVDDAAKIIGCWKALAKQGLSNDLAGDHEAMKRAVAFCQVIEVNKGAKTHKVASKNIAGMFQAVVEAYQESEDDETASNLLCEAAHVDGSMNASEKDEKLTWLKAETPENTCRILSNVRCLSEGVDVPALDAVLFLTPRNSQVDVVQSVGRVMRNAPGKKRGYVILPVVIPAGMEPTEALNDNKTYAVVWQVLQALRSHDDRFDAMVNKLDLIGRDTSKMEIIAITDKINKKAKKTTGATNKKAGRGSSTIGSKETKLPTQDQTQLAFEIGEIEKAIYAKLVQKVGNRHHWEDWANDIAKIARTHITRITTIIQNEENTKERDAFRSFAGELRDDLNDQITDEEIIEMLAQHLITKPVFDALFKDYSFAQNNPISVAMQATLDILQEHRLDKEADTLQSFYDSVQMRADGIDSAEGKQKIIVELYDKFFRNAFPKMTERLGIVYTPVEVVDFIIHSVNELLQSEFGLSLGSKDVHIIDPFTGTGTFITRLLQSGLISQDELERKYTKEIHANELVLLAYYIAAVNIEAVYHSLAGGKYRSFEGICLTDTFQMYENEDLLNAILVDNSTRRKRQKAATIKVIISNPPYSIGQRSENDNNDNIAYPGLDERIRQTYVAKSKATLARGLYDSYIRSLRWASDRIGDSGVIGFVTNAGFIEASTADGLRRCLVEEFSSVYVFHLRGNARTSGESRRKEKDNIFGGGSRAPIAISILVKNPHATDVGKIYFCDIGDYLSREEKLSKIADLGSVGGVAQRVGWTLITPDSHGDWLGQRDTEFHQHLAIGDKKGDSKKLFDNFSLGIATNRDAWCYNSSRALLTSNMEQMIKFYNAESKRFFKSYGDADKKVREAVLEDFIDTDPRRISWSRALKQQAVSGRTFAFEADGVRKSLYRPYTRQWFYFSRRLNEVVYQMPRLFPTAESDNLVIATTAIGGKRGFSALMSDTVVDLNSMEAGAQCFPLYLYEVDEDVDSKEAGTGAGDQTSLFARPEGSEKAASAPSATPVSRRRDAITDDGLAHFRSAYGRDDLTKESIFYYVYGVFHSPDYREKYADNLAKELPRIPVVSSHESFLRFCAAGRALSKLHVQYDNATPFPATVNGTIGHLDPKVFYRVEKMRYGKNGKEKDLSTIKYNEHITVSGIPPEAYEYIVNGKSAIDWVMERQAVRPDKDSGIINDSNIWAMETAGDPRYPLDLLLRVIAVSVETMKIVKALPRLLVL